MDALGARGVHSIMWRGWAQWNFGLGLKNRATRGQNAMGQSGSGKRNLVMLYSRLVGANPDASRRDALIDKTTAQLRAWGLSGPALLLLESHAPLAFFGSQFLIAAQPFLTAFADAHLVQDLAGLLQDPHDLERLIAEL